MDWSVDVYKRQAYTFVASVTEQIKMEEIAQNQKMDMQLLRYDKDGCLMLV